MLKIIATIYSAIHGGRNYSGFQQDGATALTSTLSMANAHEFFGEERTVSKSL